MLCHQKSGLYILTFDCVFCSFTHQKMNDKIRHGSWAGLSGYLVGGRVATNGAVNWPVDDLHEAFRQVGISPTERAEKVPLEGFVALARILGPPGAPQVPSSGPGAGDGPA